MATPHIDAEPGDFAPSVLMPGDPLRATYIAERHLEQAHLVTNVRNANGYTGTYKGLPVSVMASGMGIPSAAIYITELYRFYGVKTIVRVGTAGVFDPSLELRRVVAATECITNSAMPAQIFPTEASSLTPTPELADIASRVASSRGMDLAPGKIFTTDIFYEPDPELTARMASDGVLCGEMDTAGLYAWAAAEGGRALSLLTMSDHLSTGESLSTVDRQTSLDEMIEFALEVVVADSEVIE